jgi:hypothetical protein
MTLKSIAYLAAFATALAGTGTVAARSCSVANGPPASGLPFATFANPILCDTHLGFSDDARGAAYSLGANSITVDLNDHGTGLHDFAASQAYRSDGFAMPTCRAVDQNKLAGHFTSGATVSGSVCSGAVRQDLLVIQD